MESFKSVEYQNERKESDEFFFQGYVKNAFGETVAKFYNTIEDGIPS